MKTIDNQMGFAHPVGIGVIALTLIVIGFVGYRVVNNNDNKQLNSNEQQVKIVDALPLDLSGVLEFSKVKELAIGTSTATVTNLELENEDGQLLYKVTLSDGSVVLLDAKTGVKVTNTDTQDEDGEDTDTEVEDDADENEDALPANFTISITFEKAREIAQAKFPNSKISKIELDVEEGKVVISVRFADKARVDVDANSGDIVRTKVPKPAQDSHSSTSTGSNSGSSGSGDSSSTDDDNDSDDNDTDEADDSTDNSGSSNSGSGR